MSAISASVLSEMCVLCCVVAHHKLRVFTMGYIAVLCVFLVASNLGTDSAKTFQNLVRSEISAHNETQANKVGVVVETSQPMSGGQNQAIGINWNKVIDLILDIARKDIVRLGKSEVDLPEIAEEFTNKVLLVKVHGDFKADKGWLKDLSTVQRTGDVKVTREGSKFTITCAVGLGRVELGYGHYRAKVRGLGSVSGHIKGSVGRNSIRVTASVDVADGKCMATLMEVKVVELDGLKIKVSGSGFGPLNWLITKATNSYTEKNRKDIVTKIEQGLSSEISKSIKDFHCEQYIGLLVL